MKQRRVVGQSVIKNDALAKVLGRSQFASDLKMPGMLQAKVLRSTLSHAKIKHIDILEAQRLPGVVAVLTHQDVPGANSYGILIKDEPVLVVDKIRQQGDALALVAAETEEIAIEALALIKIDYEELPALFCAEEAMQVGSPMIHENTNILTTAKIIKGDADSALKSCDIVVTNNYTTQMVDHCPVETEAGIAYMDGDVVTIRVSTQNPHYDRRDVAINLGIPQNKIRIMQSTTGGGFGGKLDISTQCHLALLTWKTGRPVRLVYDREESFIATSKRHPFKIFYTTGASKDGLLQAVKVRIIGDTGAYASYGPATLKRAAVHATGPYEVPNVIVEAYCVYTNNPKAGAMRGFGVPQVAFAHESQMDQAALSLGISPVEIRLKNALRVGSKTATGQLLTCSVGIVETITKASEKAAEILNTEEGH